MARRRTASAPVSPEVRAWMQNHSYLNAEVFVPTLGDEFVVGLFDIGEAARQRMSGRDAEPLALGSHADLEQAFLQAIEAYETPGNHQRNGRGSQLRDIEPGIRNMASRSLQAEEKFIEYAQTHGGLSRRQAEDALQVYRKAKAIKLDVVTGQFTFTHGAYGDRDVLRRAASLEP